MENGKLAYFAGLVDGEAYIGLLKAKRTDRDGSFRYVPRIIISMLNKNVNRNVLSEIHEIFGGSLFIRKPFEYRDRIRKTHKQQVAIELRYVQALNLLKTLQPFLRIKKQQVDLILSCNFRPRFRVSEAENIFREKVYLKIRSLNDGKGKIL
jgi:hypothetical protein